MARTPIVSNPESRTPAAVVNLIIADMVSQTDTTAQALASDLDLAAGKYVKYNGTALTVVTNGDSHDHSGGDGAQINHTTLSNIGTNTHSQIDSHIASTSNPHSVGIYTYTAGENVSAYEVGYMKSDGKVWKGKADAATTAPIFCIALASITANNTGSFQVLGEVTNGAWSWTIGGLIYLSPATAGALTQTIPTTSGHIVQIVALALTATKILFKAELGTLELT